MRLTKAQRAALRDFKGHAHSLLWNAAYRTRLSLVRHGLVAGDGGVGYVLTDAGRSALADATKVRR